MDELREAMEAAYDKAEAEQKEMDLDVSRETNETPAPETEPPPDKETDPDDSPAPEKPAEDVEDKAPEKSDKRDKAPASWTPTSRETWGKIPEAARAQIAKRESEINTALQSSAQARQAIAQLNQVLAPYRPGLVAAGIDDPMQAIGTLFKTEAQLRGGNVQEKAYTIASLIKEYGVDIGTLDTILTGEKPQDTAVTEMERLLDARLAPVNNFLQQQQLTQQQTEYQQQVDANQAVEQFSENAEFLDQVRNDMADLLDAAARRGQQMTLQQAYDKACAIDPEINKIMAQRAKEQKIMGTKNEMDRKRQAAASITGQKGGDGPKDQNMSLRDTIADAWNSQMG